ncbi:MAG TPA: hypothetical protein VFJ61_02020 [Solirubrobacterales bacterium]|nr:hypothetical protein [Solirubrobacterales bacterium]
MLGVSSSASAFEGGGRSPSGAPTVEVGPLYNGQLNNHKNDTNYSGFAEVAFWRLPPVSPRDIVTVDWHAAPFTDEPGNFPICLTLVQGIDDYNWGSTFEHRDYCGGEGSSVYELPGSGTGHTEITVQEATTNSSYLEFFAYANETELQDYETYPYDFKLGPILHYLGLAFQPVERISAGGVIRASANLATGQPAPDGLPFNLTVTWEDGGIATYTGTSSGGQVAFQLALPESAYGKYASFVASHPADGNYQGIETEKMTVKIAKPKAPPPPPPSPCNLAEKRELVLQRQFLRLKSHARYARGAKKRHLSRRAKRVKRRLAAARSEVRTLC